MKNKIFALFISMTIVTSVVYAQPILTATGINPIIGDVYTFKHGAAVSPGGAGMNQIWNLSSITTSTFNLVYTTSAPSTPTNSPYAASNIAFQNLGNVYYYTTSNSSLIYRGNYYGGTFYAYFPDPETILNFPFSYNDSLSDTWHESTIGSSYYTIGISDITYDGYGALILPTATFNNVVRIHYTINYDEYNIPTSTIHGPYIPHRKNHKDGYKWYLNGNHQPIVDTYTVTSIDYNYDNTIINSSLSGSELLSNIVSSISEDNSLSSIVSFPNPATNEINFKLNNNFAITAIEVFDNSGKKIYNETLKNTSATDVIKISTSDFENGIYFVKFTDQDGQIGTEKISIVK